LNLYVGDVYGVNFLTFLRPPNTLKYYYGCLNAVHACLLLCIVHSEMIVISRIDGLFDKKVVL